MSKEKAAPTVTSSGTAMKQTNDDRSVPRRADLPVVHGYEYGPHRGRTQPVLIVDDCAHCDFTHFHRNPGGRRRLQRSCPVTGRAFILLPRVRRLRGGRRG